MPKKTQIWGWWKWLKKHPRIQNSIKRCILKKTQDETKMKKRKKEKNFNNPTRKLRRILGLKDKAEE